jgi:hypothetical protein
MYQDPRKNGMDTEAATIEGFNPGGREGPCVEPVARQPRHAEHNRFAMEYGYETMDMPDADD